MTPVTPPSHAPRHASSVADEHELRKSAPRQPSAEPVATRPAGPLASRSSHLLFAALVLLVVAALAAVLSPARTAVAPRAAEQPRTATADAEGDADAPSSARASHPAGRAAASSAHAALRIASSTGAGATPAGATPASAPLGATPGTAGEGPYLPYSLDSFFRSPLPASTPVSATSAAEVAYAKAQDSLSYLSIRGAHGVGWGIAYGLGTCSDPVYRIGAGGNLPASQEYLRTVGFHAPASTWQNIPQNTDAPFLVVDTCGSSARPHGSSIWGAGTSVAGNTVTVSTAGSFDHDSNGLDSRNPLSDSPLNERSRGVIPDSMVIRLDLLQWAIQHSSGLGHVLEVFWPGTSSAAGFASPMVGAEGGKTGVGAEGDRFRIKAGIDLAARPGCSPTTNPVGLAIARTLQDNGAYIGDNSGSGAGIKTEENADFPGLTADSLRGCMTWDDIEFLPRGWQG